MTTKVAVRKRDADKVLAAVRARFPGYISDRLEDREFGPQLVKNFDYGYGPTPYAIVWEEGPYDWTMTFTAGGHDEETLTMLADAATEFGVPFTAGDPPPPGRVDGVFLEPITGWALGIYPN